MYGYTDLDRPPSLQEPCEPRTDPRRTSARSLRSHSVEALYAVQGLFPSLRIPLLLGAIRNRHSQIVVNRITTLHRDVNRQRDRSRLKPEKDDEVQTFAHSSIPGKYHGSIASASYPLLFKARCIADRIPAMFKAPPNSAAKRPP